MVKFFQAIRLKSKSSPSTCVLKFATQVQSRETQTHLFNMLPLSLSLLPLLGRQALEEINRRCSCYKSSALCFPIHSLPRSSPP